MKNQDIGYLIKKISVHQKSGMDASLSSYNLTSSQLHVLFLLDRHGGEMTQRTLEEALGVSHPTVVGLVSRLEKQGFITTEIDPDDRRHKKILPTEKALNLKEELGRARSENERKMTSGFSEKELKQLNEFLQRIYANISDGMKEECKC
ncbi:MAG: MarR family transcriptional regulator [Erysipelotrichaceae bacterium]|nr:MarR family transcriptional regulator [Erysipelotrichaceae bacterium]